MFVSVAMVIGCVLQEGLLYYFASSLSVAFAPNAWLCGTEESERIRGVDRHHGTHISSLPCP